MSLQGLLRLLSASRVFLRLLGGINWNFCGGLGGFISDGFVGIEDIFGFLGRETSLRL